MARIEATMASIQKMENASKSLAKSSVRVLFSVTLCVTSFLEPSITLYTERYDNHKEKQITIKS